MGKNLSSGKCTVFRTQGSPERGESRSESDAARHDFRGGGQFLERRMREEETRLPKVAGCILNSFESNKKWFW